MLAQAKASPASALPGPVLPISAQPTVPDLDGIGLEALLLVALRARPHATVLREPARRESWSDAAGDTLSATVLDERVNRVAGLLSLSRLPERAQAMILAPHGSEQLIAIMAALRAGLRPTLLPLTASQSAIQAWLDTAGPAVAIGTSRCGDLQPARMLRDAAARSFNARLVCAFGPLPPDGVVPLDAVIGSSASIPALPAVTSPPEALTITVETPSGHRQVASESELVAGAVEIARLVRLGPHARVLSLMMTASVPGLAAGPYLALLTGAELLALGHFSLSALWAGLSDGRTTTLVAPASIEPALRAAGIIGHGSLAQVLLLHRNAPADLPPSGAQPSRIIDIHAKQHNELVVSERR
jgi:hypothetical protein